MDHKINKVALLVSIIYVLIDILFHYYYTTPFETSIYFILKVIIAYFVTLWVLKSNKPFIGGMIVSFIISLYYRLFELIQKLNFGVRAPDINFIDRSNIFLFALIWFMFHALAYYSAYVLIKKVEL